MIILCYRNIPLKWFETTTAVPWTWTWTIQWTNCTLAWTKLNNNYEQNLNFDIKPMLSWTWTWKHTVENYAHEHVDIQKHAYEVEEKHELFHEHKLNWTVNMKKT